MFLFFVGFFFQRELLTGLKRSCGQNKRCERQGRKYSEDDVKKAELKETVYVRRSRLKRQLSKVVESSIKFVLVLCFWL